MWMMGLRVCIAVCVEGDQATDSQSLASNFPDIFLQRETAQEQKQIFKKPTNRFLCKTESVRRNDQLQGKEP